MTKCNENDLLPNWCLGILVRVPDKEEKVPRLAPACLIGCTAYEITENLSEQYTQTGNDCGIMAVNGGLNSTTIQK